MKKGMKLALLAEQHGESLADCKGCEICERMHFIANDAITESERYRNILNKGDEMTLSDVKKLRERGIELNVIRQHLGITNHEFIKLTKALGIYKNLKVNTDPEIIKQLRLEGLGWKEIAEKVDISTQTLRLIRKREGWV